MITVVRSEWLKLRTTAVPWVLAGVSVLFTGLFVLVTFLTRPDVAPPGTGYTVPHTVSQLRDLVGASFEDYIFALLLGVLCITTEYRHQTVTTAFLVTPRRWRLVGGKIVTAALVGVGLALLVLAVTIVAGGLTLSARGGSFSAMIDQVPAVAPGFVAVFALFAILGVGVGALLTNQVAAIAASLGWFVIAQSILISLVHSSFKWTPTGAAAAVANLTRGRTSVNFFLFTWWQGGLLMLGYGLAFALVGSAIMTRRDVT